MQQEKATSGTTNALSTQNNTWRVLCSKQFKSYSTRQAVLLNSGKQYADAHNKSLRSYWRTKTKTREKLG